MGTIDLESSVIAILPCTQGIDLPVDDLVLFLGEPPLEGVDLGLHLPALLGLHDQPVARGLPLPLLLRLLRHLGVGTLQSPLLLHVGLF